MKDSVLYAAIILLIAMSITAKNYYEKYTGLLISIEQLEQQAKTKQAELNEEFKRELLKIEEQRNLLEKREQELLGIIDSYTPDYDSIRLRDAQASDTDSGKTCVSQTATDTTHDENYSKECRLLLETTLRNYERSVREAQEVNAAYSSCYSLTR